METIQHCYLIVMGVMTFFYLEEKESIPLPARRKFWWAAVLGIVFWPITYVCSFFMRSEKAPQK